MRSSGPTRLPRRSDAATATPQAGIFGLPDVGRLADPVLATGLADLCTGLDLFEDPDHPFFGELRLLHAELLGMELYFQVDRINEDVSVTLLA